MRPLLRHLRFSKYLWKTTIVVFFRVIPTFLVDRLDTYVSQWLQISINFFITNVHSCLTKLNCNLYNFYPVGRPMDVNASEKRYFHRLLTLFLKLTYFLIFKNHYRYNTWIGKNCKGILFEYIKKVI